MTSATGAVGAAAAAAGLVDAGVEHFFGGFGNEREEFEVGGRNGGGLSRE